MAEPTRGGLRWLRRLWRHEGATEGSTPGRVRVVAPSEEALAGLEVQLCEGMVLRSSEPLGALLVGIAAPVRGADPILDGTRPVNLFGRVIETEQAAGPGDAVAAATGMALAGLRATTFVTGHELVAAHAALRGAARHMAPLVLHAALGEAGHAGYHAVEDAGCFQVLAGSGQEALDWSLVARRVAECAICPGLVATDGDTLENLELPEAELVRAYLGAPGDAVPSATEAQRILFGHQRRRLLAWFDPNRPVASGERVGASDRECGRGLFFWEPLAELVDQSMNELGSLTGRRLSWVDEHRMEDAELVLVAQGAVARAARAAADALRRSKRLRIGVLGLRWLRPFPSAEIARALDGHRVVAVVEALEQSSAGSPLFRNLAEAVDSSAGWVSARCGPSGPAPGALAALCELLRTPDPARRVDLETLAEASVSGEFPRRDALLQSVAHAFPGVGAGARPGLDALEGEPPGMRSAALVGREAELPHDAYRSLAAAVGFEGECVVRGSRTLSSSGLFEARVRAAREDFADPGSRAPVSMLLVASDRLRDLGEPVSAVSQQGLMLVSTAVSPQGIWHTMPVSWRRLIRERCVRVFAVGRDLPAGLELLGSCLDGELDSLLEEQRLEEIAWRELPEADATDRPLPGVVERIAHSRQAHDSLPRFWGEVLQPLQSGAEGGLPDPLTASGVVPAGASALAPEAAAAALPLLDPDACTGCGRCWSVCPDSAIGASALGTEPLFTAMSHRAGTSGEAADALRRAHKHLATRLGKSLAGSKGGRFDRDLCREAWEWLAGQLGVAEADLPAHQAAFDATLQSVVDLKPIVTECFFREPERAKKGGGDLLVLAFDPRTCLGCGLCSAVCPEEALRLEECGTEEREAYRKGWKDWEALPDTSGETIARAAENDEVGPLAALLLSRHCAQAQLGSGEGEPGSGQRLALRWVSALVERHGQRRATELLEALDRQRAKLEVTAREGLAAGLSDADLGTLEDALASVARGRADLSALGDRLGELGSRASIDRNAVLRKMRMASELERIRERLSRGEDGLGRARFGVAVAGDSVAEWAARFPHHPFFAPLTLAPGAEGAELARGLARGLVGEHVDMLRSLRRAELEAESPPDRTARLEAIESSGWAELDAHERSGCTPLLLVADDVALLDQGFETLTRLLDSDLPVKIVLLDGCGRLEAGTEPALVAMAHRRAFVLSTSLAHPEHFARGVADALAWPGPALVHVHAPSPQRHGFAPEATLDCARRAVEGRAHLLLRYDPGSDGLFGLRASLEGNPGMDEDWGGASFAEWAAGEARFADQFEEGGGEGEISLDEWIGLSLEARRGCTPVIETEGGRLRVGESVARGSAERLAIWHTLQELTGERSPFTDHIRAELAEERDAQEQARLAELEAKHESRQAEVRAETEHEARERLIERLIQLSGFGATGLENTSETNGKGNGA